MDHHDAASGEAQTLRAKAALLTALSNAALGKAGAAETYRDVSRAWAAGVLTDQEMAGLGKAVVAVENQRRQGA
jgi:hypothetical protein